MTPQKTFKPNYHSIFVLSLALSFWFLFIPSAFAQWVYFDTSFPCADSFTADSLGNIYHTGVGLAWRSPLGSFSSDVYVHCMASLSGDFSMFSDLSSYTGVLPPLPAGYSGGIYSQADLDAAIIAASSSATPMSFAQGGEIAAAVASACLVAIAFGLVRKAMT